MRACLGIIHGRILIDARLPNNDFNASAALKVMFSEMRIHVRARQDIPQAVRPLRALNERVSSTRGLRVENREENRPDVSNIAVRI